MTVAPTENGGAAEHEKRERDAGGDNAGTQSLPPTADIGNVDRAADVENPIADESHDAAEREAQIVHVAGLLSRYWLAGATEYVAVLRPGNGTACRARFTNPDYRERLIREHITGEGPIAVHFFSKGSPDGWTKKIRGALVGAYTPLADDSCPWGAFDVDGAGDEHKRGIADAKTAACALIATADGLGLPLVPESSKSAKGFHLWAFFNPPAPRADVQGILRLVFAQAVAQNPDAFRLAEPTAEQRQSPDFRAELTHASPEHNAGVEIFPKLVQQRKGAVGSLIWLPFWSGSRKAGGSRLLDRETLEPIDASSVTELPVVDADRTLALMATVRSERADRAAETRSARATLDADAPIATDSSHESEPQNPTAPSADAADEKVIARARKYLDAVPPAVEGESGDFQTFKTCAHIRRGFNLSPAITLRLVREWNAHCLPPWSDDELRKKIDAAENYSEIPWGHHLSTPSPKNSENGEGKQESQASRLVKLALESGAEFWHTPDEETFVSIRFCENATAPPTARFENRKLRSRPVRSWLARLLYRAEEKAPSGEAIQAALNVLDAQARFEGPVFNAPVRVSGPAGASAMWLDLGAADWRAVRITPDGWDIPHERPAPRFVRGGANLPLPKPVPGGTLDELRDFVNITDADWPLLVAWLVAALRHRGPYPILVLNGEQGSAKTTACRVLRKLIDPSKAPTRSQPKDDQNLQIWARKGWVIAIDNLSSLPEWLSDALCRLATDGGLATRELYSDDDEVIFEAQRPIMLNGIPDFATKPDLLDRSLRIMLPAIPKHRRVDEDTFWRRFEAARPRILGALLDAAVMALQNIESIRFDELPRMADFAKWVAAAEPALPWTPGTFMARYEANRESVHELAFEAEPVAAKLLEWFGDRIEWEGRASDLLAEINRITDEKTQRQRHWPKAANALSAKLRRLAPNFRAVGIEVNTDARTNKQRTIHLTRVADSPSLSSLSSPATNSAASTPSSGASATVTLATYIVTPAHNSASRDDLAARDDDAGEFERHAPTGQNGDADDGDGDDDVSPSLPGESTDNEEFSV